MEKSKEKEKQLKKAFSSLVILPKISSNSNLMNISNIKSGSLNETKKETFLTITTDDIGFAIDQNNIIEKKILNIKKLGSKPWETSTDNDIYNPYWTRNRNIIRKIKDTIRSDGNKFNISTIKSHKKYFRQKTKNIFISYSTAKNYQFKNELKMKYSQLDVNPAGLISNIKKICYNNFLLDLLKEERSKINTKEIGYQKSLKYEEKILRNDIKSFEEYKSQEKEKLKKLELELLKKISENSSLFEVIKLKLHEHRVTLAEIRKYLKSIIRLKGYGVFLFKIFGFDYKKLEKVDIGDEKILSNELSEFEVLKIIKKIHTQKELLFSKTYDELVDLLKNDPLKIYTVINNKEKMIIKILNEKENINHERNINMQSFRKEIQVYEKKFNEYMDEYLIYLTEFEKENEKVQLISPNQKILEFNNYLIDLYNEIKTYLMGDEKPKKIKKDDILIFRNLVIPSIKELKNKEIYINKLIEEMTFYEEHDKAIFSKYLNKRKIENKAKKIRQEKEILKIKEIKRNDKILEKINQIIITGKYKYNPPNKIHSLHKIKSFSNDSKSVKSSCFSL
jgi:hypothetical protein